MAVFARGSWLSLTPEPERELPTAIATLRVRARPSREQVATERARAERLVVRGRRRQWMRWLGEAERLAERVEDDDAAPVAAARDVALGVIANHHALVLGLPGRLPGRLAPRLDDVRRRRAGLLARTGARGAP
jgi:hypothetical protein